MCFDLGDNLQPLGTQRRQITQEIDTSDQGEDKKGEKRRKAHKDYELGSNPDLKSSPFTVSLHVYRAINQG